ncbi:tRNA (uracil-5-)-methyltransferase A isoform X1 [Histomonas meleagridis]|uniref:tRNA (uracil-5-)-methyltransferase-like A isoform X1 n=1 Tax=Histomonas meleagridis TaxID=135588 RepID=UPI00355A251A|nr:tRNA (uracil-5-)-methyltransferase A isoform X1 [Histomonas meleagridis]KAH0803442.1 tRNA (uracil-5-)-methyltransferase-like A isoform X1 [Histomonas meleagridis]
MGGIFSKPVEEQPHVLAAPIKQPKPSQERGERNYERPKPKEKEPPKINRRFIPETIEDPSPGDPCGLYMEGLNYHWDREKFEKFLVKEGISFLRTSKKKSQYQGSIIFDNNADRKKAYEHLSQNLFANRQLFIVPLKKNHRVTEMLCHRLRARATSDLETRSIDDRVAPWHHMSYSDQIAHKSAKFSKIIEPITPPNSPLMTVFPAPKTSAYRNNVELTVGYDLNGNICVGFNLGSRVEDVVAPLTSCYNVPKIAPHLAEELRKFIIETKTPVFDRCLNTGYWKFVLIRTTETGQSMMSTCIFGKLDEQIIKKYIERFAPQVTSLYIAETNAYEGYGKDPNFRLLSGPATIEEHLRGLQFDISPMSFFQTNTSGAEVLFSKIEEQAEVDENTILVDVCCGTGVIGLAMAHKVKRVIGVDIEEQAIQDAIRNAQKNNINNAEFIAGKAEDTLNEILQRYAEEGAKIVCIVDPPRAGLHKKAAYALRDCEYVRRIVYVSCNPESLVRDSQTILMNPNTGKGTKPFSPRNWFGVDMFPHTDRVELVMLMTR